MRHHIKLFGTTLMAALCIVVASLWASGAQAQGQGYGIRPGDTLSIEVLEDASLSREVLVLPDGRFSFPFAGTVQATGRTTDQVAAALRQGIASNFANEPNVFVSVRTLRPAEPAAPQNTAPVAAPVMNVYFLGEVNAPGLKAIPPGSTLLQAMAQSGGFTNFAALGRIQLRRTNPLTGQQTVNLINYKAISRGAALSQDIILGEGDVILVPQRRLFE